MPISFTQLVLAFGAGASVAILVLSRLRATKSQAGMKLDTFVEESLLGAIGGVERARFRIDEDNPGMAQVNPATVVIEGRRMTALPADDEKLAIRREIVDKEFDVFVEASESNQVEVASGPIANSGVRTAVKAAKGKSAQHRIQFRVPISFR